MQNYPKISIVTPNYNQGKYLEDTIISVLNQNYPNLEYIIIDGGSRDNSVEIIRKYAHKLAFWCSEPDSGMYDALQKGFAQSTGEIMAWINSDDFYLPGTLFTLAEIFNTIPQLRWLQGAMLTADEKGRIVTAERAGVKTKYDFLIGDYRWIQQESVAWRRSLWNEAGATLQTRMQYAGDFELWLRFFARDRLYVTDACIGCYRQRSSNQLSLNFMHEYQLEAEEELAKYAMTADEKKLLAKYKRLRKYVTAIDRLKLFRTDWITARFRNRHFGVAHRIVFDRMTQRFKEEYPL